MKNICRGFIESTGHILNLPDTVGGLTQASVKVTKAFMRDQ